MAQLSQEDIEKKRCRRKVNNELKRLGFGTDESKIIISFIFCGDSYENRHLLRVKTLNDDQLREAYMDLGKLAILLQVQEDTFAVSRLLAGGPNHTFEHLTLVDKIRNLFQDDFFNELYTLLGENLNYDDVAMESLEKSLQIFNNRIKSILQHQNEEARKSTSLNMALKALYTDQDAVSGLLQKGKEGRRAITETVMKALNKSFN